MKLFLQRRDTINGQYYFSEEGEIINLTVPIQNAEPVEIKIFTKDKSIEANQEVEINQSFLNNLYGEAEKKEFCYSDDISIFTEKSIHLNNAVEKAIYAIRFFLNWQGLDKQLTSSNGIYWSLDKVNWTRYPRRLIGHLTVNSPTELTTKTSSYIQSYLNGQSWEPFIAFQFLYKAKSESNTAFKWINATIAAELAIKEFFIRYNPEYETFILEIPSPPLYKLYGSILESIFGVKSPVLKSIQKGVEVRNRLVHRPNTEKIEIDKANTYVEDIEYAIFHLLSLLYSNDDLLINKILRDSNRVFRGK
jgi:hypothetical protein